MPIRHCAVLSARQMHSNERLCLVLKPILIHQPGGNTYSALQKKSQAGYFIPRLSTIVKGVIWATVAEYNRQLDVLASAFFVKTQSDL